MTEEVEQETCKPVTRDGECKQVCINDHGLVTMLVRVLKMLAMLQWLCSHLCRKTTFNIKENTCAGADEGVQEGDCTTLHQAGGQSSKGGQHHYHQHPFINIINIFINSPLTSSTSSSSTSLSSLRYLSSSAS